MSPIFPEMRISSARSAGSDGRNFRNRLMGSSSSGSSLSSSQSNDFSSSTLIPLFGSAPFPSSSSPSIIPSLSSPTDILFINPNPNDLITVSPPNRGSSSEDPTDLLNGNLSPGIVSCWTNQQTWLNDPWTSAFSSGLLLLGILFLLYGYRFFKTCNFFMGLILASSVIYIICLTEEFLPSWGNYGVSISAGILFGLIMTLVQYVSLFIIGLHLGVLLGVGTIIVLRLYAAAHIEYDINGIPIPWADGHAPQTWPQTIWFVIFLFIGLGLIFACCSLYFQKACTILGSSIYGAGIIVAVIDYYFGNLRLLTWLYELIREAANTTSTGDAYYRGEESTPRILEEELPCLLSWVMISTWPALTVAGVLGQCFMTGKATHHQMNMYGNSSSSLVSTSGPADSGANRRGGDVQKIRQEDIKSEHRQRKYRYLYQVRTAHGDVISQDFLQSIHQHHNPLHGLATGEKSLIGGGADDNSLTATYGPASQYSNTSHLTILPLESDSRQTTMSHLP